jgi:GT2 family glycosyltransferase
VTARRVSVGIVNHNGESYLLQTLRAVARLGPAVDDVLLIDSGSTDHGVRSRGSISLTCG